MAISQAMWAHGHSIQPEDPTLTVSRVGWAGQIKHPNSQGWYHISVPTAVIITDIRMRVDAALILFSTGTQGVIRNVHVYDGRTKIAGNDNVAVSGTGSGGQPTAGRLRHRTLHVRDAGCGPSAGLGGDLRGWRGFDVTGLGTS
jgi:Family of unknown function (DUF6623)